MSTFKDWIDAFKNIEKLPDKEKKKLSEEIDFISGTDNSLDLLFNAIKEIDVDEETIEELYLEWQKSRIINSGIELFSNSNYMVWALNYCLLHDKLASYHIRKNNLIEDDRVNIKKLSDFYNAIKEYAINNNITSYQGDICTNDYYYIRYEDAILSLALYNFDRNVTCEIIDENIIKSLKRVAIDFENISNYYKLLNGFQRKNG